MPKGERLTPRDIKPITPDEIETAQVVAIPGAVMEAFNELIKEKIRNGRATVLQKDVVARMVEKGLSTNDIFDKGWLNVEGIYRNVGWEVDYDKPGFNESYEASFTFSKGKK